MKRIAVLDDYQGAAAALDCWARLQGRAHIDFFREAAANEATLAEQLRDYAVIVPIRERTRFPGSLLARLGKLELLALTGRHSGHVDLPTATARGVLVTETEGSGASAFELAIGLLLAAVRRIPQEDRAVREGRWQTGLGVELAGKTLGILGLGRIGTRMAAFGRLLDMRVLAWGPTLTDERAQAAGARRVALETLCRESDVISIHLRLGETTRGLLTARHFALMKPTAYLVNTARGPIVEELALLEALRTRRIAGAALDVYDVEPLPADHPLRSLDNVVLSPHMGYVTAEAYRLFFGQAVDAIDHYLRGQLPPRALNPEALRHRPPAA
jgi:phosphoglycerate dehydrogenase-like enzyme